MPVCNSANHKSLQSRTWRSIGMCRSEEAKKQTHLAWERQTLTSQLRYDSYSSLSPRCKRFGACSCCRTNTKYLIYHSTDFPQSGGLWKVPKFRASITFSKSTVYWRLVWSTGGMIMSGETEVELWGLRMPLRLVLRFVKIDQLLHTLKR